MIGKWQSRFTVSRVVALVVCVAWLSPAHAGQVLTIQPILAGTLANPDLSQDLLFANEIFAQAGITIHALPTVTNSALPNNLDTTHTAYMTFLNSWHPPDSSTLPVWFVGTINSSSAYLGTSYCYLQPCGVWVANSASLPGFLEPDTLAHEIAHILTGFNAITNPIPNDPSHSSDPFNLLATGSNRHIPASISDINPDGLRYDQITALQTAVMDGNGFLVTELGGQVPEPGSTIPMILPSLLMLVAHRRRRTQRA